MAGTIAVKEERKVISDFRAWYQKTVIDTGLSEGVDKFYAGMNKVKTFAANTAIRVTGAGVTIAAAICPADGPLGELAAGAITAALPVAINAMGEIDTKIVTGTKDFIEEKVIGVEKPEQENTKENPVKELFSKKTEELTEEEKNKLADQYVAYLENQPALEQQSTTPTL